MKKILTMFFVLCPVVSIAEMNLDMRNQMLDSEIETYTKIRDEKYEVLKKCERETKNFKIAGLTTLGATGVGIYANIKLSEKLKKSGASRHGGNNNSQGSVTDARPQKEKDCETVKSWFDEGMATQEEVDETCG